MERIKIIKLRIGMRDPRGKLIPRGLNETLTAEIADEVATFYFKDSRTTRRFANIAIKLQKKRGGVETVFIERFQKAVTKYPGKDKEEIRDLLLEQFKQLGLNAKDHGR